MFGTWGSQVQILPLRPTLSVFRTGQPDSYRVRNDPMQACEHQVAGG